jgi:arylsulfatase A-like enzyme
MFKTAHPDYRTAHFGKWGLHDKPERWGYDVSSGHTNNFHGDWVSTDDRRGISDDDPKRIFSMTKKANDFMEQQVKNGHPFYLQVSHYALHSQHRALKETIEKYRKLPAGRRCTPADYDSIPPVLNEWILEYAAMIENLDSSLGSILDKLDELDIADNTYIIFMSDNGGAFRGNDPLRGKKAQMWEGGIRVPFVVSGPGVKEGVYCREPVNGWDLYKTFADIIGYDEKKLPENLDGCSIKPLFINPTAKLPRGPEGLVFHFPYDICDSAIRLGDYKLVLDWEKAEKHLYNIKEDLNEDNDLAKEMPDKTQELFVQLARYLKSVNAENPINLQEERVKIFENFKQNIGQDLRNIMSSQDSDASIQWSRLNMRKGFIYRTLESSKESLEQLRENVPKLGVF